ncbi:MAG: hypothetical protein AAGB06_02470, partial [Verrucomicrobiota bacterium]
MGYYFQAAAILIWWLGIFGSELFYAYFSFDEIPKSTFVHFALPDAVAISACSIYAAKSGKIWVKALILGAYLYASLFCVSAAIQTRSGYLGMSIMLLGTLFNIHLLFEEKIVRRSLPSNTRLIFGKALLQSAVAWAITLIALPMVILNATQAAEINYQ